MFIIIPSKKFVKSFKKKDVKIQQQIKIKIRILKEDSLNPILNNHKLKGEYAGFNSINITGDYRLIFEYIDKDTVLLIDIDTHSNLY